MSLMPKPGRSLRGVAWKQFHSGRADEQIERAKQIAEVLGLTGVCQSPGCGKKSTCMWLEKEACSKHRAMVTEHMRSNRNITRAQIAKCRAAGIEGPLPGEPRFHRSVY